MLEKELFKSLKSTIYERITSPLSGAFIISWTLWNWKLLYYLVAVDSKTSFLERIDFINKELIGWWVGIIMPIISTVVIIGLYPWIRNLALKVWLLYEQKQREIKFEIERTERISEEESYRLRLKIQKQEAEFNQLLTEKENEIKELNNKIKALETIPQNELEKNKKEVLQGLAEQEQKEKKWNEEFENIIQEEFIYFDKLYKCIVNGTPLPSDIDSVYDDRMLLYLSNDLITKVNEAGKYEMTEKGKYFYRLYKRRKQN